MKNKRTGTCSCGARVAVGAGEAYRCLGSSSNCGQHWDEEDGGWHVRCSDTAACQARKAERKAQALAAQEAIERHERTLHELRSELCRPENLPPAVEHSYSPQGEEVPLADPDSRIYGGGEWAVIEPAAAKPRHIWWVQNNGHDGDDWSGNNVRTGGAGAIGWRMPWTVELEQRLRAIPASEAAAREAVGRAEW